jgi:hypothetical protein
MNITIVATLCTVMPGILPGLTIPACHEEIVTHVDSLQACIMFPANLAQWKMAGRFADDSWTISKVRCIPGSYEKRDAI